MPYPPNRLIEEAFLAPTIEVTRRVEIYEYDGKTPWKPEIWPHILIGGSVSVDNGQESRRGIDLDLYNYNHQITPEAGEFWYDKVIKAFYGIVTHQDEQTRNPAVIIVEEEGVSNEALRLKRLLAQAGIKFVDYNPLVENMTELSDYDIVVSVSADYTRKLALLTQAYNAGKSVLTFNVNSTGAQLPLLIGGTGALTNNQYRQFENADSSDPVSAGWDRWEITEKNLLTWGENGFEDEPLGPLQGDRGDIVLADSVVARGRQIHRMTAPGAYRSGPELCHVPVTPGDVYYVEFRARKVTSGNTGGVGLVVRQLDGPNFENPTYPGINKNLVDMPQGQWVKVSGYITVQPGKAYIRPYYQIGNTVPSGEVIEWDDVFVGKMVRQYRPITATTAESIALETYNGFTIGAAMRSDADAGTWIHTQMCEFSDEVFTTPEDKDSFVEYLSAIVTRADTFDPVPVWESQIGEFIPDSISDGEETMNNIIKVTGRDYAKRCQQSKLAKATQFTKNQKIVDIIRAVAANAGITKMKLPETLTTTLGKDTAWERDQERWQIMKDIATANAYDIWFDAEGYLRLTPQQDPLLTPATLNLTVGQRGNLISRGRKTSDASLFNHVTVVGESSDSSVPLVFGEAINDDPNSVTSVSRIGDRTKNISSPLVTSGLQAQSLAETMLSVASLEEFELSFSSILFPWIEAGEIVEMLDDGSGDAGWGPARYLITSLTLPFDLSPMSGNGKRVTKL
ncbi:minor tail protein [Gordonia phage Camerico]|nr:minor tail protein [Gordonia phage Camerico]